MDERYLALVAGIFLGAKRLESCLFLDFLGLLCNPLASFLQFILGAVRQFESMCIICRCLPQILISLMLNLSVVASWLVWSPGALLISLFFSDVVKSLYFFLFCLKLRNPCLEFRVLLLSGLSLSHDLLVVVLSPSLELCNLLGLFCNCNLFSLPGGVFDCLHFDLRLLDTLLLVNKIGLILSSLGVE